LGTGDARLSKGVGLTLLGGLGERGFCFVLNQRGMVSGRIGLID